VSDSTADPRVARAVELAEADASLSEIAADLRVSTRTASRLVHAGGARVRIPGGKKIGKKPKYLQHVLELHDEGRTVGEISEEIGDVHHTTVAVWLKEEGRTPRYEGSARIASDELDHPKKEEALQRYLAGESAPSLAKEFGLSSRTVEWWAKQANIWGQGGIQKRQQDEAERAVRLFQEGKSFVAIVHATHLDYYQIRMALDEAGVHPYPEDERPGVICPCGKKTGSPNRKYCSPEHRREYGKKRQPDSENYITFNCLGCGEKVTRYKKYGNGYQKYCSNLCAQRHTKVKKHYGIEGLEIVFDSSYECLFFGLCGIHKISCERYDREQGVEWKENGYYAPDFLIKTNGDQIAVELKGLQDDDDEERWIAFREETGIPLAVLDGETLRTELGSMTTRNGLLTVLWDATEGH
jgi:hypothetical protein